MEWRYGCGQPVTVYVPRKWDFKPMVFKCGSTSYTGGINQCEECATKHSVSEPREDESDMDWFERTESDREEY